MKSSTVNISFNDELLHEIDDVAKKEARSRSELIREAARSYLERKKRWENLFEYGISAAKAAGLTETDLKEEIAMHRRGKRK